VSERQLFVAAAAVVLGARYAVAVPFAVVMMAVVGACVASASRPRSDAGVRFVAAVAIAAFAISASFLAARAEAGVSIIDTSHEVSGVATLVSDPQQRFGSSVVEMRLDARRYRAIIPGELTPTIADARMGQRVRVRGTAAAIDGPTGWLKSRHFAGQLRLHTLERVDSGSWLWRSANGLQALVAAGQRPLAADERALFLGVVFGDDRGQTAVQQYRFRTAGTAHLMAVSGQNVVLLVALAMPLLERLARHARFVSVLALIGWFAVLTRAEPSVLRATVMVGLGALVSWQGRYASGLRVLCVAVIALVLADPLLVWSLGFRLSVGASLALITLSRPLIEVLVGPRWFASALGVSLAAQAGTAPMIVSTFGPVGLLSPLVNLVAVPLGGALMVWGSVSGPIAGLLGRPVDTFAAIVSRGLIWGLEASAAIGAWSRLPKLGVIGTLAMSALCVWPWLRTLHVRLSTARLVAWWLVAVVIVDLVVGEVRAPQPQVRSAVGSATLWSVGRTNVMVFDGPVRDGAALDLLAGMRRPVLEAVIVVGGGKVSAGAVWALRQVTTVGVVFAQDPDTVRDSLALPPDGFVIGGRTVVLSDDGTLGFAPDPGG